MAWQVQEAKQRFSEVIRSALRDGPQVITRHGEEVVVVVAADEFHRLRGDTLDFKDFLRSAPDPDELDLRRSRTVARRVAFPE